MKCNNLKQKRMDFLILTKTEFFRLINTNADCPDLQAAYNQFINEVLTLCSAASSDGRRLFPTLAYTEIELCCLHEKLSSAGDGQIYHVRKALSFIRRMLKHASTQVPPLSTPKTESQTTPFRWTGTLIELVELIYGLQEIGCINDGETSINELTGYFGKLLGIEIKDILCYNTYANIKHRKSDSRTYFLDRMRERLNLRMQRDEAKEMLRR